DCLKLHIFNGVIPDGKTHLLVWAPYIQTQQDNGDDDNVMIAVSHDSRQQDKAKTPLKDFFNCFRRLQVQLSNYETRFS
uniref:Uncharacterized protein n=1 Tax=Amphimedon queenslandica TaxID=400682 RepID=A0A1X7SVD8_AMPQE